MTKDLNTLPKYSSKEENLNVLTHLVGLFFSVDILVFFIVSSVTRNISFITMVPYYVYAISMGIVFCVSSLYHGSKTDSPKRPILRIIDHSDIYFFVFGTYLPLCLYGVTNKTIMFVVLTLQIIFMTAGIILNIIPSDSKILKIIAYIIYIIDGWLMIFFYPFNIGMPFNVFLFILIGGIIYSIGAITYAIGKKKKYFHSVFHIFVLLGALTQFIGIYLLFINF